MGPVLGRPYQCIRNALHCQYQKQWARERFRVYGPKQKTTDKTIGGHESEPRKPAEDGKPGKQDPVIAYEAAKFAPSAKGELSVTTTSIFQRCIKHFHVVVVDEHNTSQVCHRCDQITCPVMSDGHKNWGRRWCRSTNCRTILNRDRNAASNIARCLRGGGTLRSQSLVRIHEKQTGEAPRPPFFS